MNIVTQKNNFRQSVALCSLGNSVFTAIRLFGISRVSVYHKRKQYNGSSHTL